ncbi:MAG TPA: YfiR family protein [Candidatus Paceibacterota bacterium]|nr:YfiR family protein [Candidatus Paceibacterota bacterium]
MRTISIQRSLRTRSRIIALLWLAGLLGLAFGIAEAQDLKTGDPNKVMAGFIRNFAHYVIWPTNAFADEHSPWRIGIVGDDPLGDVLEKTLAGRSEQGRAFEVVRAKSVSELPFCQIVFLEEKDSAKRRAALDQLRDKPVLTVSDLPRFLQDDGIIQFQIRERIEMNINLDQARAVSLNIPAKVLEVTREVVENGKPRKLR